VGGRGAILEEPSLPVKRGREIPKREGGFVPEKRGTPDSVT